MTGDQDDKNRFRFLGNALSLDFVNTLADRGTDAEYDKLRDAGDLYRWAEGSFAYETDALAQLASFHNLHALAATDALRQAKAHRELLVSIFYAIVGGTTPAAPALEALNRHDQAMRRKKDLHHTGGLLRHRWTPAATPLDILLGPITVNAISLLTNHHGNRLRLCEGHGCGWLYLDTSKAGRRRWCSMQICGNREKSRKHYQAITG